MKVDSEVTWTTKTFTKTTRISSTTSFQTYHCSLSEFSIPASYSTFFAALKRDTNFNDAFYDGVRLVSTFFGDDSSDFRRFSSLVAQYLLCRHQFELIMLTRHMKISVHCSPFYFERNFCAFTDFQRRKNFVMAGVGGRSRLALRSAICISHFNRNA